MFPYHILCRRQSVFNESDFIVQRTDHILYGIKLLKGNLFYFYLAHGGDIISLILTVSSTLTKITGNDIITIFPGRNQKDFFSFKKG